MGGLFCAQWCLGAMSVRFWLTEEENDGHTNRQGSGPVWFTGLDLGDWVGLGFGRTRSGSGGTDRARRPTNGELRVG